jgi:uncharacterized ferredoxin-like protein
MITFESDINKETIVDIAQKLMLAARTAPKARGNDNLIIALADGDSIKQLADKMIEMASKYNMPSFERDAKNILLCHAIVLIGTKINPIGLHKCGLCGFANCDEKRKYPNTPCAFNSHDLGIAVGSAVSLAADFRIDNRIMYSVGQAAIDMNLLGSEAKIVFGIPLTASGKSPFFDRVK